MKNFLQSKISFIIAITSMLLLTSILRYNLYQSSKQFAEDFKSQNFNEIYSLDTLKISSKLNAISSTVNWECIEGEMANKPFFKMNRNSCNTSLFKQKVIIAIPEANNVKITFTLKFSDFNVTLYALFLISQILLIVSLIYTTRKNEQDKRKSELRFNHLSRQMSHDIRSPLASLNTIAENYIGKNQDDLKLLKLSIERINQISYSLLEQGRESTISKFDLSKTIGELIELKKYEFKNHEINFVDNIKQQYLIEGNKIEFERMLSNLINNAIESNSQPKVSIELEKDEKNISIIIKDNGPGIPKSILESLGKQNVTTKDKGNGLGLAHAINTATNLKADIHFQNTNSGTLIKLTFKEFELIPLNNTKETMENIPHYILVDDDQLVQLTWKSKAQKNNIKLEIFSDEQSLIEKLPSIPTTTFFYIDSELGQTKGEDLATQLNNLGYTNIYIASGHEASRFSHLSFLKGVIGKKPPF